MRKSAIQLSVKTYMDYARAFRPNVSGVPVADGRLVIG